MKRKMIAAISAAAMMLLTPLEAYADSVTKIVTNVRLNKPYININIKKDGDTDISKVKFTLKNSKGQKVATFTGTNGKVEILDKTVVNLTGIHDVDSYRAKYLDESKFLNKYYPESDAKCSPPLGKAEKDGTTFYMYAKDGILIAPDDEFYMTYIDKRRFDIVDTVTLSANTIMIDVDKKYKDIKNTDDCFYLSGLDNSNQKCRLTEKNKFNFYSHAGKKESVAATKGKYEVLLNEAQVSGDECTVADHAVKYVKIRMKFNDAFPGIVNDDLKLTVDHGTKANPFYVTYDLRGDMTEVVFSTLCHSGSVFTAFVPDSEGYVEFWISEEELAADLAYQYRYSFSSGRSGSGGGFGQAVLPKTREKINVLMEFPKSGYCIAALKPDKYTIVMDSAVDNGDYTLTGTTFTVTDTQRMQTANIKVTKIPLILGDSNRDGIININDVLFAALHVKGYRLLRGRNLLAADVDRSGTITIHDVMAIAAHVKGKKIIPYTVI